MSFQVKKNGQSVENVVQIRCPNNLYTRSTIALAQAMYEIYKIDPQKCWDAFGRGKNILKQGQLNFVANTVQIGNRVFSFEPKTQKNKADASNNFPRIRRTRRDGSHDEPYYCLAIEKSSKAILIATSGDLMRRELESSKSYEFKFLDGTSTGVTIEKLDDDTPRKTADRKKEELAKQVTLSQQTLSINQISLGHNAYTPKGFEKKESSVWDIKENSYESFCEKLFQTWLNDRQSLKEFGGDFQIDYLPEPYFTVKRGKRILYVLNNNPGHGIPRQLWENIHVGKAEKHYEEEAAKMADYYRSEDFKRKEPNAAARMVKMLEFAQGIGMDGVVNVEAFFLHSPDLKKAVFLKKYSNKKIVLQYTQLLKAYLNGKNTLAIASIGTNASIDCNALKRNEWIVYLCDVMGLNLDTAKIIPITKKYTKTTSCIVIDGDKIMAISMGSNNLPRISEIIYKRIQQMFEKMYKDGTSHKTGEKT
ncbi:MAG: hypothetical protein IJJ33_09320 [Victivallales bacterium]|nr:hypothetical protein [Victivallales bacterium]